MADKRPQQKMMPGSLKLHGRRPVVSE